MSGGALRLGPGILVRKRPDGTEDRTEYDEQRRKGVGTRAAEFRLGPGILGKHAKDEVKPKAPSVPMPKRKPGGLGKGGKPHPMSEG